MDATPYYHCIARCVRRAFLCGDDSYSGQNFDHRRQWLIDRLILQAGIFGIDICAYAIMGNHYHIVMKVDRERVLQWTDQEVMERWMNLFSGPPLVQAALAGKALSESQQYAVDTVVAKWRLRLYDLSWFMRCMNEFISRKANEEDDCTGRFWEGRFKSQALLDETAVLSCMAYVDLNPIRAGIALGLADSDFTSIQARLRQVSELEKEKAPTEHGLISFSEGHHEDQNATLLPFHLKDYIDLVDSTARVVRSDKRGAIFEKVPRLLVQLGLSHAQWLELALEIQSYSLQAIGEMSRLERYAESSGRRWIKGKSKISHLFASAAA